MPVQNERATQIQYIATKLGCSVDQAAAKFGKLMADGILNPFMKHDDILAEIDDTLAFESLGGATLTGEAPEPPIHSESPIGDEHAAPPVMPPVPATTTAPTASATSLPQGVMLPMGGVVVEREYLGQNMLFVISPETDMLKLLANITLLTYQTKLPNHIVLANANKPQTLLEGQEFTYGVDNAFAITKISLAKKTYEGRTNTYIEFWADGRSDPEIAPIHNINLIALIERATGQKLSFEHDITGRFALTVKLGQLGRYKKDVPDKGKKKGDIKDPRYPNSFWQDIVSVTPLKEQ